jgi:hypothetical protein
MGHEIGHVVRRHSVKRMEKVEKGRVGVLLLCADERLSNHWRSRRGWYRRGRHLREVQPARRGGGGLRGRRQHDPRRHRSRGCRRSSKASRTAKTRPSMVEAFFSTHPTMHLGESRPRGSRSRRSGSSPRRISSATRPSSTRFQDAPARCPRRRSDSAGTAPPGSAWCRQCHQSRSSVSRRRSGSRNRLSSRAEGNAMCARWFTS